MTSRRARVAGAPSRREDALIARIVEAARRARVASGPGVRLGIGHDCAVLALRAGEELAWHVDDQVEDVHFRRRWASLEDVGHKAAGAALSDLAAVGARPLGVQLALQLPRELGDRDVLGLVRGFVAALARAKTPLVGGNIAARPEGTGLSASVSVAGAVARGRAFRRDAARAGDGLYVSGVPGLAGIGLEVLERGRRPWTARERRAVARFLRPEPRIALGRALARLGTSRPLAVTDTSDGLAVDAAKIARASGLAVHVLESALPLEALARTVRSGDRRDLARLALAGGEDYELLAAAPEAFGRTEVARRSFVRIGTFVAGRTGEVLLERRGGRCEAVGTVGFDHRA